MSTKPLKYFALATIAASLVGCNSSSSSDGKTDEKSLLMNVRLIETTDLHSNVRSFDYFTSKGNQEFGLARTAVIIQEARDEVDNSLLFDNGDLIQGSPMGDYMANLGVEYLKRHPHPVYKAMNYLQYDAANIGNHEFNYGLDYLDAAIDHAQFPYVSANVFEFDENAIRSGKVQLNTEECSFDIEDHYAGDYDEFFDEYQPYFNPYVILDREFIADDGNHYPIKIGVIGFVPPRIMDWDKRHLECKAMVADIAKSAEYYVPKMKEEGADIIVAVPHSGLTNSHNVEPFMENAVWQLAQIEGIDALMFGHDHKNFPTTSDAYDGIPGVEPEEGTIFGKPAVMPGFWGNHIGVIDLNLKSVNGATWTVAASTAEVRELKPYTQDAVVNWLVEEDHQGTIDYMAEEIGAIEEPINSFFSNIVPDMSVQIVNEAQYQKGLHWQKEGVLGEENKGLPLLSVSAPFKGGRGGHTDYTNITDDALTRASVADLYVFDNNTPSVLKLQFKDVVEWLESVASQQYQQITDENLALLHQTFRTYNYDVFFGGTGINDLNYEIDVSVPSRYQTAANGNLETDADGNFIVREQFNRIKNLTYKGQPVNLDDYVLVVTNNFRAGSTYPGVGNADRIYDDEADTNRDIVAEYLDKLASDAAAECEQDPSCDEPVIEFDNMHNFKLVGAEGKTVTFMTSGLGDAITYAEEHIEPGLLKATEETGIIEDKSGYRVFELNM